MMLRQVIMTVYALSLSLQITGVAWAFTYQIDDGNAEFRLGPGSGTTGVAWINSFQVAAGGTTLTTIEIALAQEIDGKRKGVRNRYLISSPRNGSWHLFIAH